MNKASFNRKIVSLDICWEEKIFMFSVAILIKISLFVYVYLGNYDWNMPGRYSNKFNFSKKSVGSF